MIAGLVHVAVIKVGLLKELAAIPLDFGVQLQGRTLFGENKTLRGALVMVASTALSSMAFVRLLSVSPTLRARVPVFELDHPAIWGLLAGAGYVAGELPNSFIKRRVGIGPGATTDGLVGALFWIVDQIDSMIGVLLLLSPFWLPSWTFVLALLVITLVVHPSVAFVMLLLGLKRRIG